MSVGFLLTFAKPPTLRALIRGGCESAPHRMRQVRLSARRSGAVRISTPQVWRLTVEGLVTSSLETHRSFLGTKPRVAWFLRPKGSALRFLRNDALPGRVTIHFPKSSFPRGVCSSRPVSCERPLCGRTGCPHGVVSWTEEILQRTEASSMHVAMLMLSSFLPFCLSMLMLLGRPLADRPCVAFFRLRSDLRGSPGNRHASDNA